MDTEGPKICLELRQISKSYREQPVLKEISFTLQKGEILGIIGPNGAGKTTLFNIINGLIRPTRGTIFFQGQETTHWSSSSLSRMGMARTFQVPQIFPEMSVMENVLMGFRFGPEEGPTPAEAGEQAGELLEMVELADKAATAARELSLAEQHLLEVGRALATRPSLLLIDEIAAGCSPRTVQRLAELMAAWRDRGLTLLITDHLLNLTLPVSDRLLALDQGEIIAAGVPREVIRHPEVVAAYLGTRP